MDSSDGIVLVNFHDAQKLTTLSRATINRLRERGDFPIPVRLGPRRLAFVRAEIEQWAARHVEARAANDNQAQRVAA